VIQRGGLDWGRAYTNMVHELLGHAMGLSHGGGAVMEPFYYVGSHYSAHDLGALVNRYYSHWPG
jgi:hypothetical protein